MKTLKKQSYTSQLLIPFMLISLFMQTSGCSSQSKPNLHWFKQSDQSSSSDKTVWTTDNPPSLSEVKKAVKNDTAGEKLDTLGKWWLYGPGVGRTALNVGTVVIFPPYALYLLTNAGLSLAGYKPMRPLELLPDEAAKPIENGFNTVTNIPGKLIASASGVPFQESTGVTQAEKLSSTKTLK